jgi:hypothetical protein
MKWKLIDLPVSSDSRGKLTYVESRQHIPFEIKRVYYLYDVPLGEVRAEHAHKDLEQLMIATSGGFDVVLDDGSETARVRLSRPDRGLYVAPSTWIRIDNFAVNSVCMILASDYYHEQDYIRNYDTYLAWVKQNEKH